MKLVIAILFSIITIRASAVQMGPMGAISGGGGKSVVCRNSDGSIKSAEVLDLYEGRIMWGLNPQKSNESAEKQIQQVIAAQPKMSVALFEIYSGMVTGNIRFTPPDTGLVEINDSLEVVAPKNCKVEQLANYYNDNLILVDGEIWGALDETNKAAIILHEAVYATERIFGALDSRRSRHIVASLFDANTAWVDRDEGISGMSSQDVIHCRSSQSLIYAWAYKSTPDEWTLQFQFLGGQIMSKKTARFSAKDFNLMEAKTFPVIPGEDKIGESIASFSRALSAFEPYDEIGLTKKWEAVTDQQGQNLAGYQVPRYYLSWKSTTYPAVGEKNMSLTCFGNP